MSGTYMVSLIHACLPILLPNKTLADDSLRSRLILA